VSGASTQREERPIRAAGGARWTAAATAAALALLIAALALMAAVPPVDRDALTHHLAVPKLYLKHGAVVELPTVPFSYYPMNLELLYLVALYFGNDVAPKYIHFAFALATGWLIAAYLRRQLGAVAWGLLGAMMFLSLPVVVKLSITVYVDLGLIFFSTAALMKLFEWAREGRRTAPLVAAGVLAGLGLGTKPNGLLATAVLAGCIPFLLRPFDDGREKTGGGGREPGLRNLVAGGLMFTAVAAAVYSPWMIRNAAWTGNPVYPFGQRLFGPAAAPALSGETGAASAAAPHSSAELGPFSIRRWVFGESLAAALAVPVRIFFQGQDDDPRLFDGRLNPYLFFFPFAAFFLRRWLPRARPPRFHLELCILAGFSLVYLLLACSLTDMRMRYVGPILPPLVVLSTVGVRDLMDLLRSRLTARPRMAAAGALGLVLAGLLGLNALYIGEQFAAVEPLRYLDGSIPRDDYIEQRRPEYGAIRWANRHLSEDARILALFTGNRIYYSDREMVSGIWLIADLVDASPSAERLAAGLGHAGFTHLLIGVERFNAWARQRFGDREKSMLEELFRGGALREIYQRNGFALFELAGALQTGANPPAHRKG
jgi:4-amino-4-deoxy-L-arabinose transferase-like glycosyltransferase